MSKRVEMIGFTAAAMAGVTGLQREIMIDMTNWVPVVHDGVTIGGHPIALANLTNAQPATDVQAGSMSAADKQKLDAYPEFGGQFLLARGTAPAVAYGFNTDAGTGIFSDSANNFSIATAGVRRFNIDPNGAAHALFNMDIAGTLGVTGALTLSDKLTLGTFVSDNGANPASSGLFRLSNNKAIMFRNAGNTADIVGINVDNGNIVHLGDNAGTTTLSLEAMQSIAIYTAGILRGTIDVNGSCNLGLIAEVKLYCGTDVPTGWLICNGAAVSRTVYAALFAKIGTTFGAGDGSTTFNLPDFRGRTPVGVDNMGGTDAARLNNAASSMQAVRLTLGGAGGFVSHTLTIPEIPSHTHPLSNTVTLSGATNQGTGSAVWGVVNATGATGGGGAHENMQPSLLVNFIIRY